MKFCAKKSAGSSLGLLFGMLFASAVNCLALDREAFSFTNYDLTVQLDPEQHRLGVRGKVMLRNDSPAPQKIAVLQISSSLSWRSIKAGDQAVQFVTQPHTSDIDHTGGLSEAIVTLPEAIAPQATIDLHIAYEGVILLDATRLMRIGTPEDVAKSTDWDQIDSNFTAVRGAGYVAWYPIATETANLSEGDSLFAVLAHWKRREAGAKMQMALENTALTGEQTPMLLVCSGRGLEGAPRQGSSKLPLAQCLYEDLSDTPSFALAAYEIVDRAWLTVFSLPSHAVAAEAYTDAAGKVAPLVADWFGESRKKARIADLVDPQAAPFESGAFLLTPLVNSDSNRSLAAAHQLAHAAFSSPRPWIEEGLAHFMQALYVEQQKGRQVAISYMGSHRSALGTAGDWSKAPNVDEPVPSLIDTTDDGVIRSKAMFVWWMLRDMVGDAALKKAFAAYRPEEDKDPAYLARLIASQTQRDLGWFFDDWIYHDRGLPDFKVESAYARKATENSFMTAVTISNAGGAGAEVPLRVKFAGGEVARRLEVRARSKAVIRVETPAAPQEIVVNDGSVPESGAANDTYKVEIVDK